MQDDPLTKFTQRYGSGSTPWDTGITPPEIEAIVAELPPGRALDLGCGTGTNVRYLLAHGWQADGVDFVQAAIDAARGKLAGFPAREYGVYCHDVTQLDELAALRPPYSLAIDIGCGHGVPAELQPKYAHDVAALLGTGGVFMLFAHFFNPERGFGWGPEDVQRLFLPHFEIAWQVVSDDTTTSEPSVWTRLVKRG